MITINPHGTALGFFRSASRVRAGIPGGSLGATLMSQNQVLQFDPMLIEGTPLNAGGPGVTLANSKPSASLLEGGLTLNADIANAAGVPWAAPGWTGPKWATAVSNLTPAAGESMWMRVAKVGGLLVVVGGLAWVIAKKL